ncbi:NUDIX hydrolase [Streptococcus moroccensis]|uniref:8-oxo-dGTP diphosphatase n=1 Tax=Streptococcus moroccensis TaxID=1451356 RepID=A0ABT9YS91_9STRE|nr:8-oxo-dGTP diphosphatase [Streptococcus moroccensis]
MLDKRFSFSGVKLALFCEGQVLTILRDDIKSIPFPNFWDLPGGGREENETPFECVAREVYEELNIRLSPEQIAWVKAYQGVVDPDQTSVFMVGELARSEHEAIRFGDEGQGYRLMPVDDFLTDKQVIPQLQERLWDYVRD